jgi:hypothetical protein
MADAHGMNGTMAGDLFAFLGWGSVILAAVPAVTFFGNVLRFRPPRRSAALPVPSVSVLVPARNEEKNLPALLESVLASDGVDLEVLVLDDHSTDGTAAVAGEIAARDAGRRVRVLRGADLPEGWAGKMFACWQLAEAANREWLLFVDADVRLEPDAVRRLVDHARTAAARPALVSGVPRQITGTWLERLLIPLIDFVLLGFLPLGRMRRSVSPAYAAAVGQLILVDRERYRGAGGHAAIRGTFHDGLNLPRLLRRKGHPTDLVDLSGLARCRMYAGAREVWNGLGKNAAEGLGAPAVIVPMTLLLFGGQVMPWLLLPWAGTSALRTGLCLAAVSGWVIRFVSAVRFRQSWRGALAHPAGVIVLLVIQWQAWDRRRRGRRTEWKGRPSVQ